MAAAWAKEQNLLDQNVKWYQSNKNEVIRAVLNSLLFFY